jgi:hypothetical protein
MYSPGNSTGIRYRLERPLAGPAHVAIHAHLLAKDRLALLLDDGAHDRAAARELERELLEMLAVDELNRRAWPSRSGTTLSVDAVEVTGFGCRERVGAGGKVLESEDAEVVGRHALSDRTAADARQADARTAHGAARVDCHERALDRSGARTRRRRVASGLLPGDDRGRGQHHEQPCADTPHHCADLRNKGSCLNGRCR